MEFFIFSLLYISQRCFSSGSMSISVDKQFSQGRPKTVPSTGLDVYADTNPSMTHHYFHYQPEAFKRTSHSSELTFRASRRFLKVIALLVSFNV